MTAPDTPDAADLAYRADPSSWATDREAFRKGWKAGVEAAARIVEAWAERTFPAPEAEAVALVRAIRATGGLPPP